MDSEALQERLKVLEEVLEKEILRVTNLAAESPNLCQQDNYYLLAQDLRREIRDLRRQIAAMSNPTAEQKSASNETPRPTPQPTEPPLTKFLARLA